MKVNDRLPGFVEGTQVLMADGKVKNIETIKSGDYVLSFKENDAFAPLEKKKVLDIFKRVDRNILEIKAKDSDLTIKCAPGQLFIGPGDDWKVAPERADLIDGEGNVHLIEVSRITRGKHLIYDIVVEDNHSLVANGVRVHNMLYSVADVVAGRQMAIIDPGPVSNYYRRDDVENSNIYYTNGNKKKKSNKRKDFRPAPKISGTVTAAKLLSSISDLVDVMSEVVEETTPINLTRIRVAIQVSSENIVNYIQSYIGAVFNSEVSAFDKSELMIMAADMSAAASEVRNPFVKSTLTSADKLEALNQLTLLEILVTRSEAKFALYLSPTNEDRELFDVEQNGKKVNRSKTKQNKNTRASNGQFREGGSRSDFGSDKGRGGNLGKGPGQTRSTSPAGPGTSTRDKGKTGPPQKPSAQRERDNFAGPPGGLNQTSAQRERDNFAGPPSRGTPVSKSQGASLSKSQSSKMGQGTSNSLGKATSGGTGNPVASGAKTSTGSSSKMGPR